MTPPPDITTERLVLVSLATELDAVAGGDLARAADALAVTFPDQWPDEHDAHWLAVRARQLAENPGLAEWMPRAIVRRESREVIGHCGFHGAPGVNARDDPDAVEIGYTIVASHRRRGYASESVRALLRWAREQHRVPRVIASVGPDNLPSLALVGQLGFMHVGRHWDDEDGEELEFVLEL